MIFMCIFSCDSTSPIEKALYYVSMQVLLDRKVTKDMLKFLIYPSRTSSDEVIFGVGNLDFLTKLLGSFHNHSRKLSGDVGCHLCEFFARKPG